MKVEVYNKKGEKIEALTVKLPEVSITPEELSQVLRAYIFNLHQGTKKAKTRGEVAHSDRKPWRQKGTGRARAGSKNSPIWVGGGVAHGPRPYTKRLKVNKKQKRKVFAYMLAEYFKQGKVVVLDLQSETIKTRDAFNFLKKLAWHPYPVYTVVDFAEEDIAKSFRNLEKVKIRRAQLLSPFDLYKKTYLIVSKKAFEILNKRLKQG